MFDEVCRAFHPAFYFIVLFLTMEIGGNTTAKVLPSHFSCPLLYVLLPTSLCFCNNLRTLFFVFIYIVQDQLISEHSKLVLTS